MCALIYNFPRFPWRVLKYRIRVRGHNEIYFRVKSIHSAGVVLSHYYWVPVSIKLDLLRNIKKNRQANHAGKSYLQGNVEEEDEASILEKS